MALGKKKGRLINGIGMFIFLYPVSGFGPWADSNLEDQEVSFYIYKILLSVTIFYQSALYFLSSFLPGKLAGVGIILLKKQIWEKA
jgi:hypothetical protein